MTAKGRAEGAPVGRCGVVATLSYRSGLLNLAALTLDVNRPAVSDADTTTGGFGRRKVGGNLTPSEAPMVTVWIVVALLAVLIVATVPDNRRRRSDLQATLPPGLTRTARRKILRNQRAQNRAAQARFAAEHPYLNNAGDGGGAL